jgi:hypothetical protein
LLELLAMRSAAPVWHGLPLLLIALVAFFAVAVSPRRTATAAETGVAGDAVAVAEAPREAGDRSDGDATAPMSTPMILEAATVVEPPRPAPAPREGASAVLERLFALEDTPPPRPA